MVWTAVIVAVVLLVLGLCFGKVIEANIYEEVGKWVFMGLLIICSCEALAYTLSQFCYHGGKWDPTSAKYRSAKKEFLPVKYSLSSNCLRIIDSYAVSKILFREALEDIEAATKEDFLWVDRSMSSLRREWATHNLAYALGIKRERAKDVCFDTNQKWYTRLMYAIIGTLAIVVIK